MLQAFCLLMYLESPMWEVVKGTEDETFGEFTQVFLII